MLKCPVYAFLPRKVTTINDMTTPEHKPTHNKSDPIEKLSKITNL